MNYFRRPAIWEKAGPVAIHLVEGLHAIILRPQTSAAVLALGDRHGRGVPEKAELVGEIVNVNGAVRAKIVVESKENVAHLRARRRL
jgi:hypothetical protein